MSGEATLGLARASHELGNKANGTGHLQVAGFPWLPNYSVFGPLLLFVLSG